MWKEWKEIGMELSEEWKSVFPVGTVSAPLRAEVGPLLFSPLSDTVTHIGATAPTALSPPASLSLARFLATSTTVLPSTASFLSASFLHPSPAPLFSRNRLHLLPHLNGAVLFFPTGPNLCHIGYLFVQSQHDNILPAGHLNEFRFGNGSRIANIVVNPSDCDRPLTSGYLLVATLYSAHWLRVKAQKPPILEILGFKLFKQSPIADACWNPHLPEESAVLLEDGSFFIFDLNSVYASYYKGKRFTFLRDAVKEGNWIGFQFTWHPRVFLVGSSLGCYSLDTRSKECQLTPLSRASEDDVFVTLSKSPIDDFQFVLVSKKYVILCDVRRPLLPLLKWTHKISNANYVDVSRLSDLRSNPKVKDYADAVSLGCGIILGSFWNSEFNLFCYGPSPGAHGSRTIRAWEIPSEIVIAGGECCCGGCVFREELWKEMHDEWIPWQKKREIVLGFGILSKYLDFSEADEFGGFTVVRLTSSGKIEAQRFAASWRIDCSHKDPFSSRGEALFYDMADENYRFPRKFTYLKLHYLLAYLNNSFSQTVGHGMDMSPLYDSVVTVEIHKLICDAMNACGFGRLKSAPAMSIVFNNITTPASVHEIAIQKLWSSLPVDILQLAFTRYKNVTDDSSDEIQRLEFNPLPIAPQPLPFWLKPPSNRANKWLKNRPQSDSVVGPVLPLPILLALHEVRSGYSMKEFSEEKVVGSACEQAMEVAHAMANCEEGETRNFLLHAHTREVENEVDAVFVSKICRGKEMFDAVCPIELKFDSKEKRFSNSEGRVYKMLKRHFATWQTNFHPYKEFLSRNGL